MKKISRRDFIKIITGSILSFYTGKIFAKSNKTSKSTGTKKSLKQPKNKYKMSVVTGSDHAKITRMCIEQFGGMERFVKPGSIVVVKPNMSWDRTPEQAANVNPAVASEVVKMCYEAGAKKVKVFDRPCANAQRSYRNSGVAKAARQAGADVFHVEEWNYIKMEFDNDSPLEDWTIYRDAVTADCFINLPVLKHHSLTGLTLCMKNLMGVLGGNRGQFHWNIHKNIAHLTDYVAPDLNIMDATRVLLRHGPSGGNLEDVEEYNTVMCGIDPVLVDSESARLVDRDPMDIGYIKEAHEMGIGKTKVDSKYIIKKKI